jgi:hypothetical protein
MGTVGNFFLSMKQNVGKVHARHYYYYNLALA